MTSMTPVGRTPGFLYSSINRLAMNASKLFSVPGLERCILFCKLFTKFAIDVRGSKGLESNQLKPKFCANCLH